VLSTKDGALMVERLVCSLGYLDSLEANFIYCISANRPSTHSGEKAFRLASANDSSRIHRRVLCWDENGAPKEAMSQDRYGDLLQGTGCLPN
jgi:hypothetical protein